MAQDTGLLTLLDIAKQNGLHGDLVDEAARAVPELTGKSWGVSVPAVTSSSKPLDGIDYKTLVRVGLPTVGFRNVNQGTDRTKSRMEQRTFQTYTSNPRWGVDVAAADRFTDPLAVLLGREAKAHLQAELQMIARAFYYGDHETLGFSGAFPGLLATHDTDLVVDALGTADNTCSSVWAVTYGADEVAWLWGKNGTMRVTDPERRDMEDLEGKKFTGWHQELYAYPGLQQLNRYSVGRIKKITAENGKTLTDDMIRDLLLKFPVGYRPQVLFMSRRSIGQLQDSRTATNPTGDPAPFPQSSHGVPILVTDSISDTEPLTL